MKRILEFSPTDQDVIVSRSLVMVHQTIDSHFPGAKPASQRFAKTAFGEEPTLTKGAPISSDRSPSFTPQPDCEIARTAKDSTSEHFGLHSGEKSIVEQIVPKQYWRQAFLILLSLFFILLFVYLWFL